MSTSSDEQLQRLSNAAMNFEQQIDGASEALAGNTGGFMKEPWVHGVATFVVIYVIFLVIKPGFLKDKTEPAKLSYKKALLWSAILGALVFGGSYWYKSKHCAACLP